MICKHSALAAFCVGGVVGCSSHPTAASSFATTPPWDSSPVQTDSLVYHLVRGPSGYRAFVGATFRNTTGSPVYFARCNPSSTGPVFNMRRTGPDSTRRLFQDWGWACVGGVSTGILNPGDSMSVRMPVGSFDQPTMKPPLEPGDIVGDIRMDFSLCTRFEMDSDRCKFLPQAQRSSNAFSVRY